MFVITLNNSQGAGYREKLGRAPCQTNGEADAEYGAFTRANDRCGQRPEVGFPDQLGNRGQRRLRSKRGLRDGVNRSTDERSAEQCQCEGGQPTGYRREADHAEAFRTAWSGKPAVGSTRAQ